MQQYFSHICDGTDVQADWRGSYTYGRAPNAIDISQGSLTCPSYTDTEQNPKWDFPKVQSYLIIKKEAKSLMLH